MHIYHAAQPFLLKTCQLYCCFFFIIIQDGNSNSSDHKFNSILAYTTGLVTGFLCSLRPDIATSHHFVHKSKTKIYIFTRRGCYLIFLALCEYDSVKYYFQQYFKSCFDCFWPDIVLPPWSIVSQASDMTSCQVTV